MRIWYIRLLTELVKALLNPLIPTTGKRPAYLRGVLTTNVSIRIAGANGDGVESSGALLGRVAALDGMEVFGNRGYQSIIRGGHVWFQVRIGDEQLYSAGDSIDILVALNQDSIKNQK